MSCCAGEETEKWEARERKQAQREEREGEQESSRRREPKGLDCIWKSLLGRGSPAIGFRVEDRIGQSCPVTGRA